MTIFVLLLLVPVFYFQRGSNEDEKIPVLPKFEENENISLSIKREKPDICSKIDGVTNDNNIVTINFKNLKKINLDNFIFETKFVDSPLFFESNSFKDIKEDDNKISFTINLPFVSKYEGFIHCVSDEYKKAKTRELMDLTSEPKFFTSQKISMKKDEFDEQTDESQIKCFGETFGDRYCQGKNIYFIKQNFVFYTKAIYSFPDDFVLLAPRNNTNCTFVDRLSYSPIVVHEKPESNGEKKNVYVHTYVPQRYRHINYITEFMFPIFLTIKEFEGSLSTFDREFLAISQDPYYSPLYKIFSDTSVISPQELKEGSHLFKNVVFGMKRNFIQSEEPYLYDIKKEYFAGLREIALSRLGFVEVNHSKRASFILADSHFANFGNYKSVFSEAKELCKLYDVEWTDFRDDGVLDIIRHSLASRIMFGQHSANAANAFWMSKNSSFVEIFPKSFDCSTLNKDIASVSDVRYEMVMDTNNNQFYSKAKEQKDGLERCYANPNRCQDRDCFLRLRNQIFVLWTDKWPKTLVKYCSEDPDSY